MGSKSSIFAMFLWVILVIGLIVVPVAIVVNLPGQKQVEDAAQTRGADGPVERLSVDEFYARLGTQSGVDRIPVDQVVELRGRAREIHPIPFGELTIILLAGDNSTASCQFRPPHLSSVNELSEGQEIVVRCRYLGIDVNTAQLSECELKKD